MAVRIALLVYALACVQLIPAQTPPAQSEAQKAIEAFRRLTATLAVRPGAPARRANGAASGGGGWHGRLFENFRNDFLDAIPHELVQRERDKSLLRRNQFGFNLSGPVVIPWVYHGRRRTFFSVSYEGVRERVARSNLSTIPTLPERTGDFSATVDQSGDLLPIYDARSTRPNPGFIPSQAVSTDNLQYLRDPFPGNRMGSGYLDNVAQKALGYYPAPNAAVGPFFQNNYFLVSPSANEANGLILRFDHTVGERHRLSTELAYSNGRQAFPRLLDGPANPGRPERRYRSRDGEAQYVFTLSPQTINSFTMRAGMDISNSGEQGLPDYAGRIGLAGVGGVGFPVFRLLPYLAMGASQPQSTSAETNYSWTNLLSMRRGSHTIQTIARHFRDQTKAFQAQYPAGSFHFTAGLTSLPGIVNTGHGFASFVLGLPEFAEKSVFVSPSYFRRNWSNAAVRHQYDAGKGFNFSWILNVGHWSPRYEKYDRQSTIDLSVINPVNGRPGALVVAGQGGRGRAFQPHFVKLEPSLAVAWNPLGHPNTVLRASFSRTYFTAGTRGGGGGVPGGGRLGVGGFPGAGFVGGGGDGGFGGGPGGGPGAGMRGGSAGGGGGGGTGMGGIQWATQAFNAAPVYISPNVQLEPAVYLRNGLPALPRPLPDTRPEAANDTIADFVDQSKRQPTRQMASLSIERRFRASVVVTLAVSHNGSRNYPVGPAGANLNAIPLPALQYRDALNDETFNRSLRPYPQYKSFDTGNSYPIGRSRRDELQVTVEKRSRGGLGLSFQYEFSRAWDDYSGFYGLQDYYNRRNEWALSTFNSPHRITVSTRYELPIGRGKALLSYSGWIRHFFEGWALSSMSSVMSGEPLQLRPLFNNTGGVVTGLRVNVVPGANPQVKNPGPELWFNPAAFDQPDDFTIGNGFRTHPILRNPIFQSHDLSINKRFSLGAGKTLEFGAVGMNFLNHANWNYPDMFIGPADAPNVNAGKIIGSSGGRVMQLEARLSF